MATQGTQVGPLTLTEHGKKATKDVGTMIETIQDNVALILQEHTNLLANVVAEKEQLGNKLEAAKKNKNDTERITKIKADIQTLSVLKKELEKNIKYLKSASKKDPNKLRILGQFIKTASKAFGSFVARISAKTYAALKDASVEAYTALKDASAEAYATLKDAVTSDKDIWAPSQLIHLGAETFDIPTSIADSERRKKLFAQIDSVFRGQVATKDAQLKEAEKQLETSIADAKVAAAAAATAAASTAKPSQAGGGLDDGTPSSFPGDPIGVSPPIPPTDSLNPSAATPPKPPVSGIQPVSATLQPKKKKSEDIKPAVVAPAPEAAKAPNAAAVVPEPAKAPTKAQAAVPAKTPTKVELEQKIATLKIEIKNDLEKVKTAVLEQLQEEEVRLIKYLGMDARIVVQMAPYMAEFFDKLPRCSSDIRMGLNQECEVAYFVIWSTLNELKKQLSMATVEKDEFFMPDKNVATTESIVHDIDAMFPEYTAGVPDLDIYRLFTVGKPGRTVDISAESKIAELFKMTSQEDEYIRTMFKIAKKDESQSPRTPDPGN